MRRPLAILFGGAIVLGLGFSGCSGGKSRDIRDGEPRVPDDEGVVTALTFEEVTLDGSRTYDVSEDLIAFDTYNLQLEPMLKRRGQYVQIGLDGDTMIWMAGISAVLQGASEGKTSAFYTGVLERTTPGRAVFRDGTVLKVGDGVEIPRLGLRVDAEIDTASHQITRLTARE